MDTILATFPSNLDEKRLRDLASGLIRAIEEPSVVLERLGFTAAEYAELSETRMFRQMLAEAQGEWAGAHNTHKRIKLKAAVTVEEALPHFYQAMVNPTETLSSKVKAFEVISRIAGLGIPEPVAAGNGQMFKLEINLGGGVPPLMLGNGTEDMTIEHSKFAQSPLFNILPLEDL